MGFFGVSGPVRCWICDGLFSVFFFSFPGGSSKGRLEEGVELAGDGVGHGLVLGYTP